jgi:hypothetical protein
MKLLFVFALLIHVVHANISTLILDRIQPRDNLYDCLANKKIMLVGDSLLRFTNNVILRHWMHHRIRREGKNSYFDNGLQIKRHFFTCCDWGPDHVEKYITNDPPDLLIVNVGAWAKVSTQTQFTKGVHHIASILANQTSTKVLWREYIPSFFPPLGEYDFYNNSLPANCIPNIVDRTNDTVWWRRTIANDAMERHNVTIIPVFNALADLGNETRVDHRDCRHFRQGGLAEQRILNIMRNYFWNTMCVD